MSAEVRVNRMPDDGKEVLGDMDIVVDGKVVFSCKTIELPWLNNQRSVSCVNDGAYIAKKVPATVNLPYEHILLQDVAGRDGICIHIVNYVRQLRGCIGVGKDHTDIDGDGQRDVTASKVTFNKIMKLLPNKFNVVIKWV